MIVEKSLCPEKLVTGRRRLAFIWREHKKMLMLQIHCSGFSRVLA
jgi:hypothetical protein